MLEFVDSDLYFVQDKNNFINPLLQVGSGSGSVEKITGSGGPKITGSGFPSLNLPKDYIPQEYTKRNKKEAKKDHINKNVCTCTFDELIL